ncbi:MAG: DUF4157 domain-containing protein [Defluviitaleaceae bacterium]|nr:DUF4157 domain-containing protein [Defluviitaleaceae bacterium]
MYVEARKKKDITSTRSSLLPENELSNQRKSAEENLDYVPDRVNWTPMQGKGISEHYLAKRVQDSNGTDISRLSLLESPEMQLTGMLNPYSDRELDLPESLAESIQGGFGIDMSKLSLLESPEIADMGAKATAQGNVIRFAPGEFKPDTTEGLKILGHELNHVREQAQGKIKPNVEGTNIHFDPVNEAASDRVGDAFASGELSGADPVSVDWNGVEAVVQGLGITTDELQPTSDSNNSSGIRDRIIDGGLNLLRRRQQDDVAPIRERSSTLGGVALGATSDFLQNFTQNLNPWDPRLTGSSGRQVMIPGNVPQTATPFANVGRTLGKVGTAVSIASGLADMATFLDPEKDLTVGQRAAEMGISAASTAANFAVGYGAGKLAKASIALAPKTFGLSLLGIPLAGALAYGGNRLINRGTEGVRSLLPWRQNNSDE